VQRRALLFERRGSWILSNQPGIVDHCRNSAVAKEQRTDSVRYTSLGFSYEVHDIAHTHV